MAVHEALLALVADAALGAWLGAMAFFSFVAAPRIFGVLGEADAGRVVNSIFPRYYEVGVVLGTAGALAGLARGATTGHGIGVGTAAVAVLAALAVATAAYARWVLIPKMDAAGDDAFQRYHRQSVLLNGVAMLAVAAALVASHLA